MKVQLTSLLLTLALSSSSFASCLDTAPSSRSELKKEILKTNLDINNAIDSQKLFADIAKSANKRHNVSASVAAVSTLPILTTSFFKIATFTDGAALLALWGVGGFYGAGYAMSKKGNVPVGAKEDFLFNNGFDVYEIRKLTKELGLDASAHCSYDDSLERINDLKNEVLTNDLNGSIKNHLKDRVTFGGLSRNATRKLHLLAAYKTILLEMKLKELKKIKL